MKGDKKTAVTQAKKKNAPSSYVSMAMRRTQPPTEPEPLPIIEPLLVEPKVILKPEPKKFDTVIEKREVPKMPMKEGTTPKERMDQILKYGVEDVYWQQQERFAKKLDPFTTGQPSRPTRTHRNFIDERKVSPYRVSIKKPEHKEEAESDKV